MNGYDFGPDTEVIEPAPEHPRIQWFHRRNFVDFNGKAKGLTVGWHSQQGKWEEWDTACAVAGFRTIHLKQGGEIVPYWQLGSNVENEDEWGSASPFVLAKGCYSEAEMGNGSKGFNGVRAGIAYGWGVRESGTPRKALKFRALLPEVYGRPVIFTVSGKAMVNCMFDALGKDGHYRVLRANNARLEKQGIATKTPYWGFRLTLKPGEDTDVKGKDGSFEATRIITDIPRSEITDEFLASHHIGEYRQLVQDEIKASNYSIEWSMQVSQEIYGGTEEAEAATMTEDNYEHPFNDSPVLDPDSAYASEYAPKPQAKPQPSNNATPKLSKEQLGQIKGTALIPQREFIQNKLGRPDLAQASGLTREKAVELIKTLPRR